ncbi:MAG: hypothetical protein HC897_09770 [Thermoanaerobaculia bacterium]|nr:hypothetical protein [Thermoanaerobaculia bacterium]
MDKVGVTLKQRKTGCTRRITGTLPGFFLVLNCFGSIVWASAETGSPSTFPSVEIVQGEIILRKSPEEALPLTNDGRPKFSPALNPSASKVVYHESYNPYARDAEMGRPDLPLVALEIPSGQAICRLSIPWVGRWIDAFEWLDERWLLTKSEFRTFVDTEKCRSFDNIFMLSPQVSQDKRKIAFVFGTFPLHFRDQTPSYDIGLAFLGSKSGDETWFWHPIFPKLSAATYPDEEWRTTGIKHRFAGDLGWDAASRRLAFVQEIDGKFWFVCLDVEPVLQEKAPIILLREPFEMINPSQAPVSWDGDAVTVMEGQGWYEGERERIKWTFRCPPAGSPAATTETGPAVAPDPPST